MDNSIMSFYECTFRGDEELIVQLGLIGPNRACSEANHAGLAFR